MKKELLFVFFLFFIVFEYVVDYPQCATAPKSILKVNPCRRVFTRNAKDADEQQPTDDR